VSEVRAKRSPDYQSRYTGSNSISDRSRCANRFRRAWRGWAATRTNAGAHGVCDGAARIHSSQGSRDILVETELQQ